MGKTTGQDEILSACASGTTMGRTFVEGNMLGSFHKHMTKRRYGWLAANVPDGMTIMEFLLEGLLSDAMEEDDE